MTDNHIKPSKEELEANALKALEEAEALKNKDITNEEVVEEEIEDPEEVVEEEEPTETEDKEEVEDPEEIEDPEEVDYKDKFIQSTKEAQILHNKNKKKDEAIEEALSAEVTDEELQAEYSDWDVMSDLEKRLARDNAINNKRIEALNKISVENKDAEAWNKKVDVFTNDPATLAKFTTLEGKQEEFKVFATKPSRRGADLNDIVSSFLWEVNQKAPVKKKGKMFEIGTGGDNQKRKQNTGKLTLEEGRKLRNTDYKKWLSYTKAGKIESL